MPQSGTHLPHELDHIRAQKHNGRTEPANLCWACAPCNAAKGPNIAGHDPETGLLTPLFNPRTQQWSEHFEWIEARLRGRSPEGRTTIDVLNINAEERIEHRRLLMLADAF